MTALRLLTSHGLTKPPAGGGSLAYVGAAAAGPASPGAGALSVSKPSGVAAGDTLILLVARRANSTSPAPTPSGGWTLLDSITAGNARAWLYKRTVAASEPSSYSIAAGGWLAAIVTAFTGVTIVTPSSVATSRVAPSLSAGSLPTILYGGWVNAANSLPPSWSAPSGMTLAADTGSDSNIQASAAYEALAATGATGTRTPSSSAPTGAFATWSVLLEG